MSCWILLICAGFVLSPSVTKCADASGQPACKDYLYVWTGAEDPAKSNDFLATIDVTPKSKSFGSVVSVTEVNARGTEAHHIGLSADGKVAGAGGLLSFISGQPDVFFFDLKDKACPRVLSNSTAKFAAGTDAFVPLPGGGFLATLMTSRTGRTPGRVAEFDKKHRLVAEYPSDNSTIPPTFNPHGIAVSFKDNRMVTVDFLELASTVLPTPGPVFRTTLNIWDLKKRTILKTLDLGPDNAQGLMDAMYIIGSRGLFHVSSGLGSTFLVDSLALTVTAEPVFELSPGQKIPGNCIMTQVDKGKTVLLTSYALDRVYLLDITDPYHVRTIQIYQIPPQTPGLKVGPHFIAMNRRTKVFATTQYFVQQNPNVGIVTTAVEKTVRLWILAKDKKSFRPHPIKHVIDFKTIFPERGVCRPHGVVFSKRGTRM